MLYKSSENGKKDLPSLHQIKMQALQKESNEILHNNLESFGVEECLDHIERNNGAWKMRTVKRLGELLKEVDEILKGINMENGHCQLQESQYMLTTKSLQGSSKDVENEINEVITQMLSQLPVMVTVFFSSVAYQLLQLINRPDLQPQSKSTFGMRCKH